MPLTPRARPVIPALASAPAVRSIPSARDPGGHQSMVPSRQLGFRILGVTWYVLRHYRWATAAGRRHKRVAGGRCRTGTLDGGAYSASPREDFPRGSAGLTGTAHTRGRTRNDPSPPQTWPPAIRPRCIVPTRHCSSPTGAAAPDTESRINHHSETWLSQDVTAENWDLVTTCCR